MNSAIMRLYTSSTDYFDFDTNIEGMTRPSALDASTAKVEIAVTAGRCLGGNQLAATFEGELVIKQFPSAFRT